MNALLRTLIATALLSLAATSAAEASIVSYDASTRTFKYSAVNNEDNDLTLTKLATSKKLVIEDPGANIVGTDRCVHTDPENWHRVVCKVQNAKRYKITLGNLDDDADIKLHASVKRVAVSGGSGKDKVFMQGAERTYLYGESGNDSLIDADAIGLLDGGTGNDVLLGGMGDDHLIGATGVDHLYGQGDDDLLSAFERFGTKDATIDCGSGFDEAKIDASEADVPVKCELPAKKGFAKAPDSPPLRVILPR